LEFVVKEQDRSAAIKLWCVSPSGIEMLLFVGVTHELTLEIALVWEAFGLVKVCVLA